MEKDIVFYDSLSDMQAKALYYLEHEDERKQIAENGHKKVKELHTYDIRIKQMLEYVL